MDSLFGIDGRKPRISQQTQSSDAEMSVEDVNHVTGPVGDATSIRILMSLASILLLWYNDLLGT